nr:MAG TPA: hypothetical protein [Caudoviricetes sp.]DAN10041.1 MAG TPA: hypothetical protein [Caudoviricetes sp.]DAN10626.1 MAG TPA: hypothetical protein [Caudoviricetes sp.]
MDRRRTWITDVIAIEPPFYCSLKRDISSRFFLHLPKSSLYL